MRPLGTTLLSALGVLISAGVQAAPERIPPLTVTARYSLESSASPAIDLRWSGSNRLYVLRPEDGVSEVELAQGAVRELRLILPGPHQQDKIHAQQTLAVAGGLVASASGSGQFLWTKAPATGSSTDSTVVLLAAAVSDFDLDGDSVLFLGPCSRGDAFFWTGSVSRDLGDLEPANGLDEAKGDLEWKRRSAYQHARASSIRVLPNGDRLVVAGYDGEARLLSAGGSLKAHWSLRELGVATETTDRFLAEGATPQGLKQWLASGVIVDEALVVGKTPAVIVRQPSSTGQRWQLVLLESSGLRRFAIPIRGLGETDDRLRADVDAKGNIAILAGYRSKKKESVAKQELIIVTVPD